MQIKVLAVEVFAETKSPKISLRALKVAATYSPTTSAVPSAWLSLTTLFGMGRGGTSAL